MRRWLRILALVIALLLLLRWAGVIEADGLTPWPKQSHGLVDWSRIWALEGMVPLEVTGPFSKPIYVPAKFAEGAVSISYCESRWDGTRVGLAGEKGKLQIHPIHEPLVRELGFTWAQMSEARPNLIVAVAIWRKAGESFKPWTCDK